MIVDSSALIAILFREPDRERMLYALSGTPRRRTAAPNMLETGMVVDRRDSLRASMRLDQFFARLGIEVVPFGPELVDIARNAFHVYGRGRHPARLNFGDCVAYALAKAGDEPLLFEGNDFAQTDIVAALA